MISYMRRNETLVILCIQNVLMMMGYGLISPILPQYARSFGISITMVGLLITAYGAARISVDIPTGTLAERIGRRPVLLTGPLLLGIGSVACGLAGNYWQLLGFRVIQGLGSAIFNTTGMIMLADISSPHNRGQIMSLYQGTLLLGSGLGPTLGGFIAQYFGLRAPFYVYAVFCFLTLAWAYFRLPETKPAPKPVLATTQALADPDPPKASLMSSLKPLLGNLDFMMISLVTFGSFFTAMGSQSQILPLLANDRLGSTAAQIGMALTVISIFRFAVLFFCGKASDRLGRKIMITPGSFLFAIALVMLAQTYGYWFLIVTCVVWGIGSGISGPTPSAYVADILPKESYSIGMGLYRAVGDLGFVTGPVLLGWLADTRGYSFSLLFNAAFIFIITVIFQIKAREPVKRG